jgi:SAM-dependent methyltransferase
MTDAAAGASRERWNARYDAGSFEPFPAEPAEWLVEHRELLGAGAGRTAIDVACGDGRNARALAELGFAVDAVDVSDVAIARLRAAAAETGLRVDACALDLEHDAPPPDAYDVVVCMNYLQRDLFGALGAALRPGGLLLYETFSRAHVEELGRAFNPAFVLGRNELLRAFGDLHVLHYREGVAERRGGPRGVASLVARRLAAT